MDPITGPVQLAKKEWYQVAETRGKKSDVKHKNGTAAGAEQKPRNRRPLTKLSKNMYKEAVVP